MLDHLSATLGEDVEHCGTVRDKAYLLSEEHTVAYLVLCIRAKDLELDKFAFQPHPACLTPNDNVIVLVHPRVRGYPRVLTC